MNMLRVVQQYAKTCLVVLSRGVYYTATGVYINRYLIRIPMNQPVSPWNVMVGFVGRPWKR